MKKLLIILFCISFFGIIGCSEKKTVSMEEADAIMESAEQAIREAESINGFEKAEYDRFNSYASENGLEGTLIYVDGVVLSQEDISTEELPASNLIVEQEDGNVWVVGLCYANELNQLTGKTIRAFGEYIGFSDRYNVPSMVILDEDRKSQLQEKNENGIYETIWSFSDYMEEYLKENGMINESPEDFKNTFPSGQYKIGVDMTSGEYVIFAEENLGYFAVTSDANGNDIIVNDNFEYNSIMTVVDGEYLELSRAYAVPIENVTSLPIDQADMFKVGTFLPAGEYKVISDDELGYYCIYGDNRQSDIVANDNFNGQSYITVSDGQYLVLSRCHIEQ